MNINREMSNRMNVLGFNRWKSTKHVILSQPLNYYQETVHEFLKVMNDPIQQYNQNKGRNDSP